MPAFEVITPRLLAAGSRRHAWVMHGAPGCFILSSVGTVTFLIHSGGTANYSVALPNNPTLTGVTFMNQAFLLDPAANSLGVITSNAGIATVQ